MQIPQYSLVNPAAGGVMLVEEVVEMDLKNSFFQHIIGLVGVSYAYVGSWIARQRTVEVFGVVEVLALHIVGVPCGFKSFVMEGDETV